MPSSAEAATASLERHEDDTAVRMLGRVEASADLMQALAELSPRQRVALVLRYFEDLSEADVAEAMGCSVGTVKSTTSRALDRLRGLVEVPADSSNRNAEGPTTTNAIHLNDRKDTCVVTQGLRTNEGSITS